MDKGPVEEELSRLTLRHTYEIHLGSWKRVPEDKQRWLDIQRVVERPAGLLEEMQFTHVEFMPVMAASLQSVFGATRRWAISRPRAGSAYRKTSCTLSMSSTEKDLE